MMPFMPLAWKVRRARVALENWNSGHPGDQIAYEWIEEMLLAWRGMAEASTGEELMAYQERYQEFARMLPLRLREEIFPET